MGARRPGRLGGVVGFDDGHELRYSDVRRMGRWYLVTQDGLATIPQWATLGPDALAIGEEEFLARLKPRRGQIKATITNQEFIAGIGNAYSDDILWASPPPPPSRHDGRGRPAPPVRRDASVITESIAVVDATVQGEGLGKKEEWREHLKVHCRADQPCPRCGSEIKAQVRSGRGQSSASRSSRSNTGRWGRLRADDGYEAATPSSAPCRTPPRTLSGFVHDTTNGLHSR